MKRLDRFRSVVRVESPRYGHEPMNLPSARRTFFTSPTRASVVALSLFLVLGCKKHTSEDESSKASTTPSATASVAPALSSAPEVASALPPDPTIQGPKTEIKVVSKGTGTSKTLAYTFKKGALKKFSLDLEIDPRVTVGGQTMPGSGSIQLKVSGTTTITEVAPNGTASRVSTFETFEPIAKSLPPEAVEQLKGQLGALGKLQIKDTVNRQGKVETLTLLNAAAVPPGAQALIGNISEGMSHALFRLPEEPLGTGGEWTETGVLDSGGVTVTNVIRYKLVKQEGSKIEIKLSSKQTAPSGKLSSAQLPPGASMELLSLGGSGDGTLNLDLETLSLSAKLKSSLSVETKASAPGAPAPVTSKTETKVNLKVEVKD